MPVLERLDQDQASDSPRDQEAKLRPGERNPDPRQCEGDEEDTRRAERMPAGGPEAEVGEETPASPEFQDRRLRHRRRTNPLQENAPPRRVQEGHHDEK